jgi:hypothetical protein
MAKEERAKNMTPARDRTLAFIFGIIFLMILIIIVSAVPNPTDKQFEVIRTVLALAGAGFAATVPGFFNLKLEGPPYVFRAGGALAVFAALYFFHPALTAPKANPDINVTSGDQSPIIRDNPGSVIIKK